MKSYVYNTDTRKLIAVIEGKSTESIEAKYRADYRAIDEYGMTYSPAFGTNDGLDNDESAEEVEAS